MIRKLKDAINNVVKEYEKKKKRREILKRLEGDKRARRDCRDRGA